VTLTSEEILEIIKETGCELDTGDWNIGQNLAKLKDAAECWFVLPKNFPWYSQDEDDNGHNARVIASFVKEFKGPGCNTWEISSTWAKARLTCFINTGPKGIEMLSSDEENYVKKLDAAGVQAWVTRVIERAGLMAKEYRRQTVLWEAQKYEV